MNKPEDRPSLMRFELAELETFLMMVREGSFSLAARQLHVSQPSVTNRVIRVGYGRYCGSDLTPEIKPDPPGTGRLTSGEAFHIPHDLAGQLIDWQPKVPMKEGVRRLLAWREAQDGTAPQKKAAVAA